MLPDRYVQTCSVHGMLGYIKGGRTQALKQLNRTSQFKAVFIPHGNSRMRDHRHGRVNPLSICVAQESHLRPSARPRRRRVRNSVLKVYPSSLPPSGQGGTTAPACGKGPEFRCRAAEPRHQEFCSYLSYVSRLLFRFPVPSSVPILRSASPLLP